MNKECMNVYKWVRIWYEIGGDVMAGMNKALRIGHFAHLKNLRDWATYWATNWRTDMTSCNNARRHIEIRCLDISSTFGHLCDTISGYVYQAVGPAIQPFETLRACFLWHALIPIANALLGPTLEFQLSTRQWAKWASQWMERVSEASEQCERTNVASDQGALSKHGCHAAHGGIPWQ